MEFATAIAANRHQGDVGVFAPVELFPGLLQDVVDEPGTVLDQPADVPAAAKAPVEHLAGLADRLLEGRDGACLQGQFSLELATVEEFGIHLRHRSAFLSIIGVGHASGADQAEMRGMVSSLRRVKIS